MSVTSKGRRWEILHSLWIGWTFTVFLCFMAFFYIGFRTRQKKWIVWGVLYTVPVILVGSLAASSAPASLGVPALLLMFSTVIGSIFHAFFVRKEYLVRLEASSRMPKHTPITSKGNRWEILHSLWIGWTFTLSFFNYIAFLYIGLRVRQWKWFLWGLFYSIPAVHAMSLINTELWQNWWGADLNRFLVFTLGIAGIFHAFWIRKAYLVRLEAMQRQANEKEAELKQQLDAETNERELAPMQSTSAAEKADQGPARPEPDKPAVFPNHPVHPLPSTAPTPTSIESNKASERAGVEYVGSSPIPANYPLPLAYSYRLVEAEFETLRILKELYRNAEGLMALLASLSLALTPTPTGQAKKSVLNAWRGKGATFGNWFSVMTKMALLVDEEGGPLYSSTKQLIGTDQTPTSFSQNMRWLIDRRDDFHHGTLPVGNKADRLVEEVRKRFEDCVFDAAPIWQHPLRLVLDYDAARHSDHVVTTCLNLSEDHPVGRKVQENYQGIPKKQDLYILQNGVDWISLYPFIAIQYCPYCQSRETYFIDAWKGPEEEANLRSIERAHEEVSLEIGQELTKRLSNEKHP